MSALNPVHHAGLIVPLDMFRISQLAGMFADILVSKARNILDAKLIISRHHEAPILHMRIEGSVIDGDPSRFWRDNVDLVAVLSRALPRQVILYYVANDQTPERVEGFMVAQQGQMVAADEADAARLPPGANDSDWPLSRLCQQMRVDRADLVAGFPSGPCVEVSLMEPNVDDQALLMTLIGQDAEAESGAESGTAPGTNAPADAASSARTSPPREPERADPKRRR